MATVTELNVLITADTTGLQTGLSKADHSIGQVKNSFATLGSSFSSVGNIISGMGPMVAGAMTLAASAVGMLAKHAFDAAIAFDNASDKIRISTGAVGAQLNQLEGSFKTVFTSIPVSAADASEAISFLSSRLGISGKELEKLATTELELARITGSALKPQLEATTRVFGDWKIATDAQTTSLDFLFKVGQKTTIGVTDLAQKLVQFGPALRQLGFSFEEAAVLIGKFQAEGVDLGKVLPGLRIELTKMADAGVKDASLAFQMLNEKIIAIKNPMEQLRFATELFGKKAGVDMVEAIKQGRFNIEALQTTIEGSRETILGAAKDTNDFAEKWIILKNKASEALEPLGKLVFDALGLVTGAFSDTEAEIAAGWAKFWADLAHQADLGIRSLADALLNADKSPFFQAGSSLGASVRAGFLNAIKGMWEGAGFGGETESAQIKFKAAGPQSSRWDWAGETNLIQANAKANWELTAAMKAQEVTAKKTTTTLGNLGQEHKKGGGSARALSDGIERARHELERLNAIASVAIWKSINEEMEELVITFNGIQRPTIEFVDGFKDAAEATKKLQEAAQDLIPAEKELEGVHEEVLESMHNTEPFARVAGAAQVLQSQFEKLSQTLPRAWNTIIDGFVKGGTAASVKIKGFASDIIKVFDTMPGKWGQSLNRAMDEVNKWITFIDAGIKLIQRILGDAQTGLAGVFEGIVGLFTKTTQAIKGSTSEAADASSDWAGAMEKMSEGMEKGGKSASESAQKWVSALAAITGALATFFGTRNQGKGIGVLGGALAGAQIGAMFGGLGAAIGAGVGALVGLFNTGKSSAQKQQEALQLEQTKQNMQQTAQNIINAALEGFTKGLAFLEQLDEFTAPRKEKFRQFFASFTKLLNYFVELSKSWSQASFAQVKAAAEAIGPVADAISALPLAFQAINGHFGVAQSSIDQFFNDFSKVMDAFFARSEVWIDGISKRAFKVANRLSPVVALISAFGTAMKDITDVKEPTDEMFGIFDRVIDKIVTHVANLSLKFDKAVLKTMANFSEKAGAALGIWKEAIESIKATVDIQTPSEASVDNVVAGIELFINKLGGAVERLITTDLARISAFANVIAPIAAAIKAWAETAEVVRGYTAVAAEVWDQIVSDFERGLVLLNLLILDAQLYVEKANIFKSLIDQGASVIAAALGTFGSSISAASSALTGSLPQGGTAIGSSMAPSSVGISSFSAPPTAGGMTVNVTVQGTVIEGEKLANTIMKVVFDQTKRGRLATI